MAYSLDLVRASGIPTKTRSQWGNRYPASSYRIAYPGRYLFMHITVTYQTGTLDERTRVVERIGAQRFPNTRFSYNAVLHRGGAIHEGQPRGYKGAHTVNARGISGFPYDLNAYGDALSYVGVESSPFGEAEIESAARWFAAKVLSGESKATDIYPHQKFAAKACPGARIMNALPEIRQRFKRYVAAGRLPGAATVEEDWMAFIDDQADFDAAMSRWWNRVMSPDPVANKGPEVTRLRVAPWHQTIGRGPDNAHTVMGKMQAVYAAIQEGGSLDAALDQILVEAARDADIDLTPEQAEALAASVASKIVVPKVTVTVEDPAQA